MGYTFQIWFQMLRNMGLSYMLYRLQYALQRRMGLLKMRFPPKSTHKLSTMALESWKMKSAPFFQPICSDPNSSRQNLIDLTVEDFDSLAFRVSMIMDQEYRYFGEKRIRVTDWHTHPLSGYHYRVGQHWSKVADFSTEAGDIKYIWEKGRFTFLYDLIRYEWHSGKDQCDIVVGHILDWIQSNPVNSGPHWVCSQEISLRVLNWIYALQFYKKRLSDHSLHQIIQSIGDQVHHVWQNRFYAQRLVRNNHVLAESLAMYSTGLLFPFFENSETWRQYGKKSFETEVLYQIQPDGSYLQHSMNYQRVLVQLLTWALRLSEVNNDIFSSKVYQQARLALAFLISMQDRKTGFLPHYGPQDGALLFPFTEAHFRDYRPQLSSLAYVLGVETHNGPGCWQEDSLWWGLKGASLPTVAPAEVASYNYVPGGYFMLRETDCSTFIRCTSYHTRPFQADNLHLDIWVNGINILRDAGTYHYQDVDGHATYFSGTAAHNTVQIGHHDQFLRGPRFVWSHWIKESSGKWCFDEGTQAYVFYGYYVGFMQVNKGVIHRRMVTKPLGKHHWLVEDWLEGVPNDMEVRQIWHPALGYGTDWDITAEDAEGEALAPEIEQGWYAPNYGSLEPAMQVVFQTRKRYLKTSITWF